MKRRDFIALSTAALVGVQDRKPFRAAARSRQDDASENSPEKTLNPNTKWLRQAKWGLFTHYLAHTASTKVSDEMNGDIWKKKVSAFQVKELADQLSKLEIPYFFVTIGQGGGYFCTPNKTHEKYFGPSEGRLSKRDLIADLAAELVPGESRCVFICPPTEERSRPKFKGSGKKSSPNGPIVGANRFQPGGSMAASFRRL